MEVGELGLPASSHAAPSRAGDPHLSLLCLILPLPFLPLSLSSSPPSSSHLSISPLISAFLGVCGLPLQAHCLHTASLLPPPPPHLAVAGVRHFMSLAGLPGGSPLALVCWLPHSLWWWWWLVGLWWWPVVVVGEAFLCKTTIAL